MRHAVRLLLKDRGFAAVAVLSLAFGIGGNTLLFSIVHAVLLRPLPYPGSDRLVFVWFVPPKQRDQKRAATIDAYLALREGNPVLEDVGTVGGVEDTINLAGQLGEPPQQLPSQGFTAAVPRALDAKPLMGRWFTDTECAAEASPVIVISYRLWQGYFGGAADIVGKSVRIDGGPATIVGVMPDRWMLFNYPAQVWVPYRVGPGVRDGPTRVVPVARFRRGVTFMQAQQAMDRFAMYLGEAFPSTNKDWKIRLEPALNVYVDWVRRPLLIIQGFVAVLLMIACVNVAGLLLIRTGQRKKEVAIRAALGAGRWRISRQLLMESLLLAVVGGLVGILLAHVGLRLFIAISPAWFPRAEETVLDSRMLGFTGLLCLATAFTFGAIPAVQSSRPDLSNMLKEGARGLTAERPQQRLRATFVVLEVSLAMILTIGAGLMLNTFMGLSRAPLGCNSHNVGMFQVSLSPSRWTIERTPIIFEQIREKISGIRGIESAAAGARPPLSETTLGGLSMHFRSEGYASGDAYCLPVSAGYFHTLGVAVLRGREFNGLDNPGSLPVVLINRAMTRRFWPGEDPIGKRVRIDLPGEPAREIVGVVDDLRHNRYDRSVQPQMYVPHLQQFPVAERRRLELGHTITYVIRSSGDPMQLATSLRAAVAELDRDLPISDLKRIDDSVAEQLWQPKQMATLLAIFAGVAAVLALTGVYGMISYTVQQRTNEIGIRTALGATSTDVLRLIIGRGLSLTIMGITIGVACSAAIMRLLMALLWGVTPADPLTYITTILAMVLAAGLASYLPARRALRIDAVTALRCD